jgi:hypothetical protein
MLEKIFDAILALVFTAMTVFSAPMIYNFVKREALIRVSKGLNSTYKYSRALTGETFDWEK